MPESDKWLLERNYVQAKKERLWEIFLESSMKYKGTENHEIYHIQRQDFQNAKRMWRRDWRRKTDKERTTEARDFFIEEGLGG